MKPSIDYVHDLVLIGGGHSHAIALKQFGMNPVPGVRLTLITNVSHTPYSGMLPGYVAGLYTVDECHIDLRPLANFAQAIMIVDEAIGLDLQENRVLCANRPPIAFDWLSIDIGSTPATVTIPGASEFTIPAKPIAQFLHRWDDMVQEVERSPQQRLSVGVVGGGAGGVELALSVQAHLHRVYERAQQPTQNLEMHLFHRGAELLDQRDRWIRQKMQRILIDRGIQLHLGESVSAIQPGAVQCESGLTVKCDRVFWVTQAGAAAWIKQSGLATDDRGFVQVNDCLQSVSHPHVFAAGDIATMQNHPRPKAGVFAVRQGKPLFENLRRSLLAHPLQPFVPQKEFLILIGTGDRSAVASRGKLGLGAYTWIWQWKDRIDRQFMDQFANLQSMSMSAAAIESGSQTSTEMRCAGCAAKVGSSVLERSLARIRQEQASLSRDDILIGLNAPDDAAVVRVPADHVLVQTVDYFPALVNDPFVFGQIAAHHCLNDLLAMGADPQSALAIATLPYASERQQEEMFYQLLSGAIEVLHSSGAELVGGHTTIGDTLAFGLSCNGLATADRLWRKSGLQVGQTLILTKPLGTGILFAGDMRLQTKGRWLETAIDSMRRSNQQAVACFRQHHATACTDITGFGLVGHLREMARASQVAIELDLSSLPLLDGVEELLQQGIRSSLYSQNLQAQSAIQNLEAVAHLPCFPLLFDPQTSGGLVASVPDSQAIACLFALKEQGYSQSCMIGEVMQPRGAQAIVVVDSLSGSK